MKHKTTVACAIALIISIFAYLAYTTMIFVGEGYAWADIIANSAYLHRAVKAVYTPRLIVCAIISVVTGFCWFINRKDEAYQRFAIYSIAGTIAAIATASQM